MLTHLQEQDLSNVVLNTFMNRFVQVVISTNQKSFHTVNMVDGLMVNYIFTHFVPKNVINLSKNT